MLYFIMLYLPALDIFPAFSSHCGINKRLLLLLLLKSTCTLLLFRPPDRRRRDVFGFSNGTSFDEGSGGNSSLGPWDNSTEGLPPIRLYPFSEDKVAAESMEIPLLKPFTVYRIDLHACNEVVGRCSAGAFVFARTKPAGGRVTQARRSEAAPSHLPLSALTFFGFHSGRRRHPGEGGVRDGRQDGAQRGAALVRAGDAQRTHPHV